MKKIIVMLLLAVALNAEVKIKETREDCDKYLTKADELMTVSIVRTENELDGSVFQLYVLKTISVNLTVANLQERYNICMRRIKSL